MQEDELIESALSGNEFALRRLHDAYITGVFNYVIAQTQNRQDAEELIQDIFYKVARNLDTFQRDSGFKTWVFAIARNTVLDYHRTATKRKRHVLMDSEELVRMMPVTDSAEEEMIKADEMQEVMAMIASLPEAYSTVLHLRIIEDFSVKETAAIMKKSPLAVKALLYRARKALASNYEREVMNE
ncbi:RNA polymerase sigma factor [Salisediminibacterium selenitireducens]|uniref:RNA polymerase, sigma-24 subunit, ECF subfamily n=1 Tax=Bacillus selenitireducens (strain ATCC 700615 / DSM 15326 / MLS10) TaxID=439292 RepID=D6XTE7_BACIE|nr:RNA polymerase sigma factor [Salisediminibacterium selenitireducens]ADH99083.1 RNA polymerase, sigma-24 subunit, ECF subfamily [[Bacillus] selenitireducens MLS10]